MKNVALVVALVLAPLMALPSAATAQSKDELPEPDRVRYQAVTEIDGGAIDVTGAVKGPEGAILNLRRETQFRPLVKLKENFDREVKDSASMIR